MARRRWAELNDEDRRRIARSDRRQLSLFGDRHTDELQLQGEMRADRRDYYAWKWRRQLNRQTKV